MTNSPARAACASTPARCAVAVTRSDQTIQPRGAGVEFEEVMPGMLLRRAGRPHPTPDGTAPYSRGRTRRARHRERTPRG
ncbi:hypothetical protein ACFQ0B_69710 [Nonomuraea thailandensis]